MPRSLPSESVKQRVTNGVMSGMRTKMRMGAAITLGLALAGSAVILVRAQSLNDLTPQLPVSDPTCPYFGKAAQGSISQPANPSPDTGSVGASSLSARARSALTAQVAGQL